MIVNRYLEDKQFDDMDHALGRPVDPLIETHRNYFATIGETELTKALKESRYWTEGGKLADTTYFHVNQRGRRALKRHLKSIGDTNRNFNVTIDDCNIGVVAKSHGEARYLAYLKMSDVDPDMSFIDFCKRARACLA